MYLAVCSSLQIDLAKAYKTPFLGNGAINFINHLEILDQDFQAIQQGQGGKQTIPIYAKALSVIQSSGTGKSRMLTEVCWCLALDMLFCNVQTRLVNPCSPFPSVFAIQRVRAILYRMTQRFDISR
jgi:hypothetical protein